MGLLSARLIPLPKSGLLITLCNNCAVVYTSSISKPFRAYTLLTQGPPNTVNSIHPTCLLYSIWQCIFLQSLLKLLYYIFESTHWLVTATFGHIGEILGHVGFVLSDIDKGFSSLEFCVWELRTSPTTGQSL